MTSECNPLQLRRIGATPIRLHVQIRLTDLTGGPVDTGARRFMTPMPPLFEERETDEDVPLRMGSIEDFVRVKSVLDSAGFDDSGVCQALKIEKISDIGKATPPEPKAGDPKSHALVLLIRIFLFLESVPMDEVERLI